MQNENKATKILNEEKKEKKPTLIFEDNTWHLIF
jgi:DTW domain-containing protein YfiP